jgi:Flp pilus assembly protein TadD
MVQNRKDLFDIQQPNMDDERKLIDGLFSDADAALERGAVGKASALYHGILRLNPEHVDSLRQLAAIEVNGGAPEAALQLFERARQIAPPDADLCHGIATALRLTGRAAESELALKAALRIEPGHGPSLYDLAMLRQQRGDNKGSSALYLKLTTRGHLRADAAFNRGVTLFRMNNLVAAERWFHIAAMIDPNHAKAFMNIGMIYRRWDFVKEALACQERAVALAPDDPEAHWNLANALLLTGDFERGFAEYEWRFKRPGRGERPQGMEMNIPRWTGEALDGKTILITLEQGLGDAIHFVRFIEEVAARGGRVVMECPQSLAALLATARGVAATVAPGVNVPEAACYAPLMSLPHLLGTTAATIPARVPYLSVPADITKPSLGGDGLRVGLVWRGNPQHENDRRRSAALEDLSLLLDVPGVRFFSLQVGDSAGEQNKGAWAGRIDDLAPGFKDFAQTAAAVQTLDLVISVDTAVAHLAGALGKPIWMLISSGNDWRWFQGRADSPWYPTLRLFRQGRRRSWLPVVRNVKKALAELIQSSTMTPS